MGKPKASATVRTSGAGPRKFAADFLKAAASANLCRIPASFALAVSALETGHGSGRVFLQTSNLFSITAGTKWRGVTYKASTGFVFRVYNSWTESINDFARLISTSKLYATAYAAATSNNKEGFFSAIQAAGYAGSDHDYAKKLLRTYEGIA